jgi:hypothetical protein
MSMTTETDLESIRLPGLGHCWVTRTREESHPFTSTMSPTMMVNPTSSE